MSNKWNDKHKYENCIQQKYEKLNLPKKNKQTLIATNFKRHFKFIHINISTNIFFQRTSKIIYLIN